MFSLDKKILDPNSRVAERMRQYGRNDEIFILIPASETKVFDLSPTVHVFSAGGSKLSQFFQIKKIGRKILLEHKIDLITTQDPFYIGLIGVWLKRKSGVPLEVQLHGDFFGSQYYSSWKFFLGRWVVRRTDKVRAVGERVKQSVIRFGVAENKIMVRPVAIDTEKIKNYQPKCDLHEKYPNYEKIFLCLGRLDPVKNIVWLVDFWPEVLEQRPQCLLLIVGDGSEKIKLIKRVQKMGLNSNIKFEDWTGDPLSYLKTADCLLFPSLSEGYGLVTMEAAAAGTPVIMTDVGVANYELKPGSKVKIVSIGDRDKFIEAILKT